MRTFGSTALLNDFLKSAVFYPCSEFDFAPIEFLATKQFSRYFYADYGITCERFHRECSANGCPGYQCDRTERIDDTESILGPDSGPLDFQCQDWPCPEVFTSLASFQRLSKFRERHGPDRLELLFACCEAVKAYEYTFSRFQIPPACVVYTCPGLSFGGNRQTFPAELDDALLTNPGGLARYMFYEAAYGNCEHGAHLAVMQEYKEIVRWKDSAGNRAREFIFAELKGRGG